MSKFLDMADFLNSNKENPALKNWYLGKDNLSGLIAGTLIYGHLKLLKLLCQPDAQEKVKRMPDCAVHLLSNAISQIESEDEAVELYERLT